MNPSEIENTFAILYFTFTLNLCKKETHLWFYYQWDVILSLFNT